MALVDGQRGSDFRSLLYTYEQILVCHQQVIYGALLRAVLGNEHVFLGNEGLSTSRKAALDREHSVSFVALEGNTIAVLLA
eukprot:2567451-Amphidinium_carterae.1